MSAAAWIVLAAFIAIVVSFAAQYFYPSEYDFMSPP
jgi:hypothetical protein